MGYEKKILRVPLPLLLRGAGTNVRTELDRTVEQFDDAIAYIRSTAISGSPGLNVFIDESCDGGVSWHEIAAFALVTSASAKERLALPRPLGRLLSVRYTLGGTGTPTVTFEVSLLFLRDR